MPDPVICTAPVEQAAPMSISKDLAENSHSGKPGLLPGTPAPPPPPAEWGAPVLRARHILGTRLRARAPLHFTVALPS